MTNREKYAKEILDIVCEGSDVAVKNGGPCKCNKITCRECDFDNTAVCLNNRVKWFKAEYVESPVDWSKVPIDTPLLVRDLENEKWTKRHFAKYEGGKVYAFRNGETSWSGCWPVCWEQAKLATDDELNANSILRADGRKEE